jgi:3-deoxy-D-manno-octulosonic-acid transferase
MSKFWARATLKTYRMFGSFSYPALVGWFNLRASTGKEDRSRLGERYGYSKAARPKGPLIWFHAASVGETNAIAPLIEHLHHLGLNVVLTTGTVTSAAIVKKRLPASIAHQYVPMDVKPVIQRFLNHWQPDMAIFAESEIWPMTLLELAARRIPFILVNARLSDRSYKRWHSAADLAEAMFENISHVAAQSSIDERRFLELGAPKVSVTGNLKVDTGVLPVDREVWAQIMEQVGGRPIWVAASTHKDEEALIADVHKMLKTRYPNLLTVIVPRHPKRANEVLKILEEKELSTVSRSSGEAITLDKDIFLGDTIGEMGLFLRMGQITFLGKSIKAKGGQNPLEPAQIGSAIISGRNVENFRPSYLKLLDRKAVRLVQDEKMLAVAVDELLKNTAYRQEMIENAKVAVDEMKGALERTFTLLDPYIKPLLIKATLEREE